MGIEIKVQKYQIPEHTKEFLGGNFWGTESYYWDAKEGKYYYISVDKSGWDENGWKYQEVTNEKTLANLKKKYNRGKDVYGDDYKPLVESYGTAVRFPHDMLVDEGEDYVMFDFYDYKPPFQNKTTASQDVVNQTLKQYNATGYANEFFKDKAYNQILLYMPQDIQDAFSAKWQGKKFGAMTTGMLAAAGQEGGAPKKLQEAAKNMTNQIMKKGQVEAAAKIVTGLAQKITGDQITANDLFTGISGVARNPNVEVLFQSMELRTFDLTFKLTPFDEQDSTKIDSIIKIFKMAMLPQYNLGEDVKVFGQKNKGLQAGFIGVPKVCAVNFMRGSGRNPYLPRYKMCAITDVNVNYTPDNVYATINNNMPVATELKLSFMETKLVFSEDVKERGF